jgi:hypothetical protein
MQLISPIVFEVRSRRPFWASFLFANYPAHLQAGRFPDPIGRIAVTLRRSGFHLFVDAS